MRRRASLTATFAGVSLAAMAVLGVVLTFVVAQLLQQQALDQAVRTATAYTDAGSCSAHAFCLPGVQNC